ncbi:hypothetical protein JOC48_001234 [Aquibacillus albus]|uniref:Uncharacterized protein n=1 Tax=Aquibacillus albus TaxID=1168171 RepID=A0ABS2MXY8_9BACI|nr:hypothetical protein [Aquibacillus albus]
MIRPKWSTDKHIYKHMRKHFDFGAETGANCTLT